MKTTAYFRDHVMRKRPYLRIEWCESAVGKPDATIKQIDGRWRFWKYVPELGKYLRVITLEDGATIHNAFPDRDFEGPKP